MSLNGIRCPVWWVAVGEGLLIIPGCESLHLEFDAFGRSKTKNYVVFKKAS
jgi:hypothetical protein